MEPQAAAWTGSAKLADFGLSGQASATTGLLLDQTRISGTPGYKGPELYAGEDTGKPVDVYAFGGMMWEMHNQRRPFEERTPEQLLEHMTTSGGLPTKNYSAAGRPSALYRGIMMACTRADPDARPTFSQLERAMDLLLAEDHCIPSTWGARQKLACLGL